MEDGDAEECSGQVKNPPVAGALLEESWMSTVQQRHHYPFHPTAAMTFAVSPSRPGCDRFVRANRPIGRAQTCAATCRSGPSSYLGPRPCFYGMWAGAPGATVGVLVMGVPRSTCWKAQLRPIYINTTSSSSTSTRTRRAQDPRGGVSREEVQDQPGEGFVEDLAKDHHPFKDNHASFTTKESSLSKGET